LWEITTCNADEKKTDFSKQKRSPQQGRRRPPGRGNVCKGIYSKRQDEVPTRSRMRGENAKCVFGAAFGGRTRKPKPKTEKTVRTFHCCCFPRTAFCVSSSACRLSSPSTLFPPLSSLSLSRCGEAGAQKMLPTDPTLEQTLRGHRAACGSLAFNATATQLASGGADGAVIVWNFKQQMRAYRYMGHAVSQVLFPKNTRPPHPQLSRRPPNLLFESSKNPLAFAPMPHSCFHLAGRCQCCGVCTQRGAACVGVRGPHRSSLAPVRVSFRFLREEPRTLTDKRASSATCVRAQQLT
jgi:hypothetical protein